MPQTSLIKLSLCEYGPQRWKYGKKNNEWANEIIEWIGFQKQRVNYVYTIHFIGRERGCREGSNRKPQPTTNGKQIDNFYMYILFLSRELFASLEWMTGSGKVEHLCTCLKQSAPPPPKQNEPSIHPAIYPLPFSISIFCAVLRVAGRGAFWHPGDTWLCSIRFDLCCIWHLL